MAFCFGAQLSGVGPQRQTIQTVTEEGPEGGSEGVDDSHVISRLTEQESRLLDELERTRQRLLAETGGGSAAWVPDSSSGQAVTDSQDRPFWDTGGGDQFSSLESNNYATGSRNDSSLSSVRRRARSNGGNLHLQRSRSAGDIKSRAPVRAQAKVDLMPILTNTGERARTFGLRFISRNFPQLTCVPFVYEKPHQRCEALQLFQFATPAASTATTARSPLPAVPCSAWHAQSPVCRGDSDAVHELCIWAVSRIDGCCMHDVWFWQVAEGPLPHTATS